MRSDPSNWQTPAEPHVSAPEKGKSGPKRAAHGRRRGKRTAEPDDAANRDLGPDADPESLARSILLQRLTEQPRSRSELETALAKRNVPSEVGARLLDRFEELGLVDDEAFARSWVESRQRTRGLAGRALAQELRRKGLDDDLVRETVDEIDPDTERENARALVRKKLRSVRNLDRQVQVRRLAGMLARKGYSSGVAYAVIREELEVDLDPDL